MARDGAVYACQSCGATQTKWSGQCPACGAWNSLVEELTSRPPGAMKPAAKTRSRHLAFEGLDEATSPPPRIITGVDEWDRVCGGPAAAPTADRSMSGMAAFLVV
ncbi:MAG: hypothetical protein U1C74_01405, partial [Phenylobacterium sp.]|nr:hypothetical protein [Phenylobacterium sp.]